MTAVAGRVEVAGIVLRRVRDRGPWSYDSDDWGPFCCWCGVSRGVVEQGLDEHEAECLWLEVVAATDRPSDDLGLPGGGST